MSEPKILEQDVSILDAFKWMYNPFQQVILVGSTYDQYHLDILGSFKEKFDYIDDDFDNWIRVIHLYKSDFKNNKKKSILCIRQFNENKFNTKEIKKVIDSLDFKSKKIYNITNDKLKELTGDYSRKW